MKKMNEKIGKIQFHKKIEEKFYGKCDCGNEYKCSISHYRLGRAGKKILMCRDCKNNSTYGNLVGKRFGKLTVLNQEHNKLSSSRGNRVWRVKCECGNEEIRMGVDLKYSVVKCFECSKSTETRSFVKRYSYIIGKKLKISAACDCKNASYYKIFGNLGIKICNEWRRLSVFKKWAKKNGLVKGKHVYLHYGKTVFCPENCFVADRVKFTPYLDPKLMPVSRNVVKAQLGFFSRLKSFIFHKVA